MPRRQRSMRAYIPYGHPLSTRRPRRARVTPRQLRSGRRRLRPHRRRGAQRYNRTRNTETATFGRRGVHRTLGRRLSALEAGSSKRWDKTSNNPEEIAQNGTTLNPTGESFSGILAIQGPLSNGQSGDAGGTLDESEQRMNDTIFVKSVRIRGRVTGVTAFNGLQVPGATTLGNYGVLNCRARCQTRIWITVLEDKRPSEVGPNGTSIVNPLPTAATELALMSIYNRANLGTFGPDNSLRSYDSSRFKVKHQECLTTSADSPHKYFDITININKTLKYVAPPAGGGANPPAKPYNYGLAVFVSCLQISTVAPYNTFLSVPVLDRKTSRTKFTDA